MLDSDLGDKRFPNVLFVGNGINRAFSNECVSMDSLKSKITYPEFALNSEELGKAHVPFPLEVVLRTNDRVRTAMKNVSKMLYGRVDNNEQRDFLRKILSAGFDDIITTNYSYELETACGESADISDYKLKCLISHTSEITKAEPKFSIHTYNKADYNGISNRIWHIHGEARKPDSMIFGHYYYGNLLYKYKELSDKRGDSYQRSEKNGNIYTPKSWIDSFILGNVYIMGFGMDMSEMDVWWLINRKKQEKASTGKTVFYCTEPSEPSSKNEMIRIMLLEAYGVNVKVYPHDNDYKSFYYRIFEDITNDMNRSGHNG